MRRKGVYIHGNNVTRMIIKRILPNTFSSHLLIKAIPRDRQMLPLFLIYFFFFISVHNIFRDVNFARCLLISTRIPDAFVSSTEMSRKSHTCFIRFFIIYIFIKIINDLIFLYIFFLINHYSNRY